MAGGGEANPRKYWIVWISLTVMMIAWLGYAMTEGDDKGVFMPGALSDGHHQLADACDACHTDRFGGGRVLQEACLRCHGDDRKKPFDSHPRAKFTDPRNADSLQHINALECVSCHVEHRPEITLKDGLTRPRDVCFHCHSDIAEDRPSHAGMAFTTCKDAGCHDFHDNRALYTDFLVKHLHEPDLLDERRVPEREFSAVLDELVNYPRDRFPVQTLTAADIVVPERVQVSAATARDWLETAHARSGVTCNACHVIADGDREAAWQDQPGTGACAQCHDLEVNRFKRGKHGMRLAAGLSPMTPGQARLPMREDAAHDTLTCNSCHVPHRYDTRAAAVEACLGCHNDTHTLAYKASPHYALWQQELDAALPPGSGVSCATCHMPRIDFDVDDWTRRIMVDHNQSATLSPNAKMLRPACLHCHGMQFSLDALADRALIERNFKGRPQGHVRSMDMAEADHQRALRETEGAAAE